MMPAFKFWDGFRALAMPVMRFASTLVVHPRCRWQFLTVVASPNGAELGCLGNKLQLPFHQGLRLYNLSSHTLDLPYVRRLTFLPSTVKSSISWLTLTSGNWCRTFQSLLCTVGYCNPCQNFQILSSIFIGYICTQQQTTLFQIWAKLVSLVQLLVFLPGFS